MQKRTLFIAFSVFVLMLISSGKTSAQILKSILGGGQPTSTEISNGIKQALELGASASADRLSAQNGFFGNMAVKLFLPPEAQKAERTLRSIGLGNLCDKAILSMNRAAEDAAKEAKPIFVSAVKQMTLKDASSILLGADTAATGYFKRTTRSQLARKFSPIIEASLAKVGATRYWGDMVNRYNRIPLVQRINPDLKEYATQKAIDGLFVEIAKEELKIRDKIGARSTPLLQKVFFPMRRKIRGTNLSCLPFPV